MACSPPMRPKSTPYWKGDSTMMPQARKQRQLAAMVSPSTVGAMAEAWGVGLAGVSSSRCASYRERWPARRSRSDLVSAPAPGAGILLISAPCSLAAKPCGRSLVGPTAVGRWLPAELPTT